MTTHRWIAFDGLYMTAIDVKAYKRHRCRAAIKHHVKNIVRRLVLPRSATQVAAAIAPLGIAAAAYV